MKFEQLKKNENGLIPAIIQNNATGDVLMLGYMNQEAYEKTQQEGVVWFFSRARQQLWKKGERSGNTLSVSSIYLDCDNDTILVKANPKGPTCHTGEYSCFYKKLSPQGIEEIKTKPTMQILEEIWQVVKDRDQNPKEGSYTNYLLEKGLDKMLKKVGEEAAEVIIAAKNREPSEVQYETADLLYHVSVVLYEQGLSWAAIFEELKKRR